MHELELGAELARDDRGGQRVGAVARADVDRRNRPSCQASPSPDRARGRLTGGVASTGKGECRRMRWVVEPSISLFAPVRPCAPITMTSQLQAFGRPRDFLVRLSDRHVQGDRAHRQAERRDGALDEAAQLLARFVSERLFVVGDGSRGGEKGILDEDDDKPCLLASRGQQRGVRQRLARMTEKSTGQRIVLKECACLAIANDYECKRKAAPGPKFLKIVTQCRGT